MRSTQPLLICRPSDRAVSADGRKEGAMNFQKMQIKEKKRTLVEMDKETKYRSP
jgi:hypothetical protein